MSKLDQTLQPPRPSLGKAIIKRSRWPGWIWAVPLAWAAHANGGQAKPYAALIADLLDRKSVV